MFSLFNQYKRYIVIAFSFFAASSHSGNMDDVMSNMFANTLTNYTPGIVYQTQSMGVVSGPSLYVRNKISNTQLVSFTPPSFKAGCQGIDAFTGAFSFISKDALVNMLRNIASAAIPYAFNVALSALCKDCQAHMAWLQKLAQDMNQANINSCEAAKKLVDNSKLKEALEPYANDYLSWLGSAGDYFYNKTNTASQPANELLVKNPVAAAKLEGNIGWVVLTTSNMATWYNPLILGANINANEVILSMTGTYITAYESGADGQKIVQPRYEPPTLTVEDFLNGGNLDVMICDETVKCLHPFRGTLGIQGFKTYVRQMLFGNGANGILQNMTSTSTIMTNAQKQFIEFAPGSVMAQMKALAVNPQSAAAYADNIADYIAAEMAGHMVSNMIQSVRLAGNQVKWDLSIGQWLKSLDEREAIMLSQINNLSNRLRGFETSMNYAKLLRENLNKAGSRPVNVVPTLTKISQ